MAFRKTNTQKSTGKISLSILSKDFKLIDEAVKRDT
jgi:hypothetical protein